MKSNARPEALEAFLHAMKRAFQSASTNRETEACLSRVFDALQDPAPVKSGEPTQARTSALLEHALEPAREAGGALKVLADRILRLDALLLWRARGVAEGSTPTADVPANAMIVGPGGLEDRRDVWVGMSLLAQGVCYPEHRHSPEEIYLFLSDGRFRHGEKDWFKLGVGGTLYNEPNTIHSMEASPNTPLLAVWCLFDARHQ